MKNKKKEISEEFLKNFVGFLIKESYNPEKQIRHELEKEIPQFIQAQALQKQLPPQPQTIQKQIPKLIIQKPHKQQQFSKREKFTKIFPEQRLPENRPILKEISQNTPGTASGLNRISNILNDPSVLSVECPGPTKNLLVNRGGAIQTTSMTLAKEEIDSIIEEIGEKTRIPISTGVFKAAFQNLLITAVISDFVGTRFLIQKRTPFKRY